MIPKIDLKLTIGEFASLFKICQDCHEQFEKFYNPRPEMIMLAEYADLLEKRIRTWSGRRDRKEYKFSVPLSVVLAIWLDRTYYLPVNTLLAKMDKALVDNRINCHHLAL